MQIKKTGQEKSKAVALHYNEEMDMAPVVVAKGQGFIAERIKEVALQYGIPLKEDRQLADYLMALDLYQEIPPELYSVVAEVLAFIYSMDRRYQ
ncbi:EscU/YscU/HrcU family type III secretion system export apparatus switch protein [Syntrophomonas palmitatica]|uniref:EscU/YscU/HrcU family type III secretion system export apparatus switch protein n=1 Tax=Syntrophomonas palmitatica TaxID=402877 RepID=UPI0006D15CA7|nr:EscU/YscU/HrcU family type III secretion system export apparatus switch protein [Syntrophomonas palmitatica]